MMLADELTKKLASCEQQKYALLKSKATLEKEKSNICRLYQDKLQRYVVFFIDKSVMAFI